MDTAWAVFSEFGYANASMDMVVARAGGSKATLYTHFKSKEELLKAVLEYRTREFEERVYRNFIVPGGFAASLRNFGVVYLDAVINSDVIEVYRLAMSEARRLVTGGDVYNSGFVANWRYVAEYIGESVDSARLLPGGGWLAAMQFRGLLEGDLVMRRLTGLLRHVEREELERTVEEGVEAFLRIYAPDLAASGKGD